MAELPTMEIPAIATLAGINNWVCWKSVRRGGKLTKLPVGRNGIAASTTRSETWQNFADAFGHAVHSENIDGLGFVFTHSAGIVGIDLDKCRNPQTGHIADWAMDIVEGFDSFTEISPSETGLHIYIFAELRGPAPERKRIDGRRRSQVEVYASGRYFTVTGVHLDGTPDDIQDRQEELDKFIAAFFPAGDEGERFDSNSVTATNEYVAERDDRTKETVALLRENDRDFDRMWTHEWTRMQDQSLSAYDFCIATHLLRAGFDEGVIAGIVAHHRFIWGDSQNKLSRRDYVARTIHNAKAAIVTGNVSRDRRDFAEQENQREQWVESAASKAAQESEELASANVPVSSSRQNLGVGENSHKEPIEVKPRPGFEAFQDLTGIKLDGFHQYGQNPPTYTMEVNGVEIEVGGIEAIMSPDALERKLAPYLRCVFMPTKKAVWKTMLQLLFEDMTFHADDDLETHVIWRDRVKNFLERHMVGEPSEEDMREALANNKPFCHSGVINLNVQALRQYLDVAQGERFDDAEVRRNLKRLGFQSHAVAFRIRKGSQRSVITRRVWRIAQAQWDLLQDEQEFLDETVDVPF